MKTVETILLHPRINAKLSWTGMAFWKHAESFGGPPQLLHLHRSGKIRMFPYRNEQVAAQILENSNPEISKMARRMVLDANSMCEKLDELNSPEIWK
jgi:hypothetical protein